jgi:ketosteroid isomerase-like protein
MPVTTDETQAVIDRHMAALQTGDIDAVMEDYTDTSVFIVNLGGIAVGPDAIRPFLEAAGQLPGFVQTASFTEGDTHYVTWTADAIAFGTDTLVVRDGHIAIQTVAILLAP